MESGRYRKISIFKEIDNESAKEVVQAILDINNDDDEKSKKYKEFERKPIELYINSPGGVVYDGLAIIDAIRNSETPVHTYCIGRAMSMGLFIYLAGVKRFAGKYCTFMYHEAAGWGYDKLEAIKENLKEYERLQKIADEMIVDKTNIMQSQLDEYKEKKSEWYIDALESVKLGISHGII